MDWLLIAVAYTLAAPPERLPRGMISADAAEALLVPALIGPPAETYGAPAPASAGATPLERDAEALMLGKDAGRLQAPAGLRCWARVAAGAAAQGHLSEHAEMFVAEHCGLPSAPFRAGAFFTSDATPESVAQVTRNVADYLVHEEEVTSVAVALLGDETAGGWYGVVAALTAVVDFEPFPRSVSPGSVMYIPGTVLDKRRTYALYVTRPGTAVDEWPLAGEGRFDIEVPLPAEPGAWRLAVTQQQKNRVADSPFALTLYAGVPIPTSYHAPRGPQVPDGVQAEEAFVARVNAERARYGLDPLDLVGDRASLRAQAAALPSSGRALYRAYQALFRVDPLPGEAHGGWAGGWGGGLSPDDAALVAVEHPVTRSTLLGGGFDRLVVGAIATEDGWQLLYMPIAPAAEPTSVRDEARAQLEARDGGSSLRPAPRLQAELDTLAAQVASGALTSKKALARANAWFKDGRLEAPGNLYFVEIPAGVDTDVSAFTLVPGASYLAIGQATGVLHDQAVASTVLLVVLAASDLN